MELPRAVRTGRQEDEMSNFALDLVSPREPTIYMDKEQPIAFREVDATEHLALQHHQLMSECGILCFMSTNRPERRGQQRQKEAE